MTLFSPPVSTPFLKAARTPGHVSGYERGGLMEDEDDDAMGDGSASSTPTLALSMHGSAAAGGRSARAVARHSDAGGADGPMSAADMDMDIDADADAALEADNAAPSPDLASPEMPAFSSRAAALLDALGPDPNTTAAVAAAAHASLRRSRLLAAPALATATAGAQLASSSASSSASASAAVPRGEAASPPTHRPMTMADVAAGSGSDGEEVFASPAGVQAGDMAAGSDDDFAVGDWDEPPRDDDEELGAMLSHLGSPGGIALSRHSLAITNTASLDEDEDEDQSGEPGTATAAAADDDDDDEVDGPSLEELTASAVATNLRRSTLAGLLPGLPDEAVGMDNDDDDDDLEPAVLALSSLGSSSSASRAVAGSTSRVGTASRCKSVGAAKHAEEFSLRLFPAMFHSGRPATSLIAVWSVVSGGQDGSAAAAFSAEAVVAALTKQGHERPPSKVKTTAMLQMLASQGFLREFTSKGNRFWRLQAVE
jgi:hypothetical protein